MRKGLLSIVIPVHNESLLIKSSVERVMSVMNNNNIPFELVLVDDGSRDSTWDMLSFLSTLNKNINAVRLSRNFGKEAAICAGLDNVKGECCIVMDSDMQHPPEHIPEMYRLWSEEGFDVIEGLKSNRGKESYTYKFFSKTFYKLLNVLSGIKLDNASDFKLMDKKVIDAWHKLPEKQTFFRGMSKWVGFKATQIYFEVAPREIGNSRWSIFKLTKLAINAITSFTTIPMQIVTFIGIIFFLSSFVISIQTIYMKISGKADVGFTTVIILLLVIGSIIMLSLGIIGLYISKIYEEVKSRPRYIACENTQENNSVKREN